MSDPEQPHKQPRVLVVDDASTVRAMARDALEAAGFAVVEASDATAGLEAFRSELPDLVLLDVQLPDLDGFTVCARLRRLPGGAHVPVVMITALDDLDSIQAAYEAGATDFVTKPVNWLVVTQRMRYMLRASATLTELERSERRLAEAQRIARLGSWELAVEGRMVRGSPELRRIYGLPEAGEAFPLARLLESIHPEERDSVARAIERSLGEGRPFAAEHRVLLPSGGERAVQLRAEVAIDELGRPIELAGTAQDVTERKQTEERIRFLAYHDGLTRLGNRRLFEDRLAHALAQAQRYGRLVAVLFLDLDHFKRINDTLGHSVGDLLLQRVAERIGHCVRQSDCVSRAVRGELPPVSRLGGDEFVVLLSEIEDPGDAARVAERVRQVLTRPFALQGHDVVIGASIGIAVGPADGENVETLLRNADAAMYHAKDHGRNNHKFYQAELNTLALRRLRLESELRKALERSQLHLVYQPKVDLQTGAIRGVEALLRWEHPKLGAVGPNEFIPVAEQGGLIVAIGEFVLRSAARQAKAWQEAGLPATHVSVNLSAQQFKNEEIVDTVLAVLEETGLAPEWLDLEITESTLMENEKVAISALERLKGIGIVVSLDDFGTGYSSLSYLKRFPVDTVKIDRSFVRDIATDADDAAIIAAIVSIARALRMKVVAEGVETEAQRSFLSEQGCDEFQGYLFSPPVSPDEIARMLREAAAPAAD